MNESDAKFYSNMCSVLLGALIITFIVCRIKLDNREAFISLQYKKVKAADSCYHKMKDSLNVLSENYLFIRKDSRSGQKITSQ